MARLTAGGTAADYTIMVGESVTIGLPDGATADGKQAVIVGSVPVTWWNAETDPSTQYTGLLDRDGASVDQIVSSDGTDGRAFGQIGRVTYPEGVTGAWASAGGGPRVWMPADTADLAADAAAAADGVGAALAAHVGAANPHGTATTSLADWAAETPLDGQVPRFDGAAGEWVPTTVEGFDPSDYLPVAGGGEIVIPAGDMTTRALAVRLPAGDRAGAADTYVVFYNAGTEAVPVWLPVFRLGSYGELRARAPRIDVVPVEVAGVAGQTANLQRWVDANGNPLAWVDPSGRMRAPNAGITVGPWVQETGAAGTGTYRWTNPFPVSLVLRGFVVSAGGTAPGGTGEYIINPKLNGTAVYSSANRPRLAVGSRTSGLVTALTTTTVPIGGYVTVDVDAVTSTPPTKITIQGVAY